MYICACEWCLRHTCSYNCYWSSSCKYYHVFAYRKFYLKDDKAEGAASAAAAAADDDDIAKCGVAANVVVIDGICYTGDYNNGNDYDEDDVDYTTHITKTPS